MRGQVSYTAGARDGHNIAAACLTMQSRGPPFVSVQVLLPSLGSGDANSLTPLTPHMQAGTSPLSHTLHRQAGRYRSLPAPPHVYASPCKPVSGSRAICGHTTSTGPCSMGVVP